MTTTESLAVLRLRQWAYDRALARAGAAIDLRRQGWIERRSRQADARLVRVLDFERAFAHLPHSARALLLLIYRDEKSESTAADILGISTRTVYTQLPHARRLLADTLDRADLL